MADPSAQSNKVNSNSEYLRLGDLFQKAGRKQLAEQLFERHCQSFPLDFRGYLRLGLLRQKDGWKVEEALIDLHRAQELQPTEPEIHGSIGGLLIKLGRYAEAIKECLKVIHDSILSFIF